MNSVVFMGKFTGVPVKRITMDNRSVVSFSLAVARKVKRKGKPDADFFNFTAWDRDADNIHRFFNKGDTILIRGRIENDFYTNKDGVQVKGNVVIVEEWEFGPKKYNDGQNNY